MKTQEKFTEGTEGSPVFSFRSEGRKYYKSSRDSSYYTTHTKPAAVISVFAALLVLIGNEFILRLLFGKVEFSVMQASVFRSTQQRASG